MKNPTNSTAQHTPTPWRAQPLEGPGHWQIINDSCLQLALVRHWPDANGANSAGSREKTKANAAFIVTACNAYEANQRTIAELTRALEDIASGEYAFPADVARHALKEAGK